jgi:ferrous iron transport protein B
VYRETKAWRWPVFLFTYMTLLAWVASFAVYQGGRALGLG